MHFKQYILQIYQLILQSIGSKVHLVLVCKRNNKIRICLLLQILCGALVLILILPIVFVSKMILFVLILFIPVNNCSVMPGRVFLGRTSTKQVIS